jgi:phosphohistidine phosphatase
MDLILWRHAEAEDGVDDEQRKLTAKGRKQALKAAQWLSERLPKHYHVIASPAVRTRQTAAALAREFVVSDDLGPGASPESILRAAGWPRSAQPVVIVGHQPTLGMTVARLLCGRDADWSLRKGAFVWITVKGQGNLLRAALVPELL